MKRLILSLVALVLVSGAASAQCQNGRCQIPQYAPQVVQPATYTVGVQKYATAFARVSAGESLETQFVAGDPSLPSSVTPGAYRCFNQNGTPVFQQIGVGLPSVRQAEYANPFGPYYAPQQSCPNGKCPLQR